MTALFLRVIGCKSLLYISMVVEMLIGGNKQCPFNMFDSSISTEQFA